MMMSAVSVGLRPQIHNSVRTLHGLFQLEWACPFHHRPAHVLRATNAWQGSDYPHPNLRVQRNSQAHKFLQSKREACAFELFRSVGPKRLPSLSTHAYNDSANTNPSSDNAFQSSEKEKKATGSFLSKLVKNLLKALGALLLTALLAAAALPSLLSWVPGRNAAISLANKMIPGTVNVSSMSLGWSKPVFVQGLTLQGTDGGNVLSIPKVKTKASLWSIVRGKSGFGDCTVESPVIDLQQHPKNNLPLLALAVAPAEKLQQNSKLSKKQQKPQAEVPPSEASLTVQVKAPNGGLQVTNGKIIFPSDAGSLLGEKLVIDVGLGLWATKESDELKDAEDKNEGLPLLATLWSETVQAEVVGFFQQKNSKLKLIKPLKAEMDLTPAVAKFYLARVNPLLGEIVGPAIHDEDMPDVILQVTPTGLELPSDHYKVNIAPMKVTLARGQVMDGILSLLSKQQLMKGRKDLTMQTSAIEANVNMPSTVDCSRLDILLADKVHVATWGSLDWISENVQMTLAIPGKSLRELLGLTKVPENYYLKIPVGGTLEKPLVEWKAAVVAIAELTARQRGGQFMQGFLDIFDSNDKSKTKDPTPEPIAALPWEENVTQ
ncbi:unnamed protein product [Calypogeia fissa]